MNRRARHYITKSNAVFWLLIIALVSLVLSAFSGGITVVIEKFYNHTNGSYHPMDTERMAYEQEKASRVKK